MTTSLNISYTKLISRTDYLNKAFERHALKLSSGRKIDTFALQEGLVSALWQTWCHYCRDVILSSVKGTITLSGQLTTCIHSGLSDLEISYVARQLSNNNPVGTVRALNGSYQEPTWGDSNKLNRIANGIGTSNSVHLVSAFSACVSLKDLQLCRNASAHITSDNIQRLNSAKIRYVETKLQHPSDLIFWIDPVTRNYLWKSWVNEMLLIGNLAIR